MELNERARARFRALADAAEAERETLSAAAIERIAQATVERARADARRRDALRVAAVFAIAASVFVVARRTAVAPDQAPLASHAEHAAPRCTAFETTGATAVESTAASRVDVHARARVDFAAGTVASLDASAHCASHVVLTHGSVAIWARDLGGGTLAVDVGDAQVTVHGTVFEVRSELDGTRYVAVREGRVRVVRGRDERWLVGGDALRITSRGVIETAPVDGAATARLAAVLADAGPAADIATLEENPSAPATERVANAPVAPIAESVANAPGSEPIVDPAASLREAELQYRAGQVDEARRLFRRVGATRGSLAEAAWIRLGRLEMRAGRTREAASALGEHRRRFPSGSLAAEARVAEAQALRSLGRGAEAESLERWVIENRPDSPYAAALRERLH